MSDLFGTASLPHLAIPESEALDALRLIRSENIGAVTFHHLLRRFGSPRKAVEALPDYVAKKNAKRPITLATLAKAEAELEAATKFGAAMILYGTPAYPARLAQISDAPPILFALGCVELLEAPRMLAMVGARNASAQGYAFARQLAREAAEAGVLPVSGLARGIDAAAHTGALEATHGATIGVIAGGIDTRYPTENGKLYDKMAREGLILSEQPFGMAPQSRAFPARNRIIAGLSQATLVVEAALRSGSLITAEYAAEAGREVFAVPGNPLDPRAQGTNQLLKQGAHLTENFADILAAWPSESQIFVRPVTNLKQANPPGFAELVSPPMAAPALALEAAEDLASRVRAKLSPSMVLVDELAAQCNVPPGMLQAVLVELELEGILLRAPGNRVSLRPA